MAIGARSQSARTYLVKKLDSFLDASLDELINHGLLALRECLPNDSELTSKNVSIAIVGHGKSLETLNDDRVQPYLDTMETTKGGRIGVDQEEEEKMDQDEEGRPLEERAPVPGDEEQPMDQ